MPNLNRAGRRAMEREKNALARNIVRAQQPKEYELGFHDGGMQMCKAAEVAAAIAMNDVGFQQSTIIRVLRKMEDKLAFFAGEDELIQEAYDSLGIEFHAEAVFSDEKFG